MDTQLVTLVKSDVEGLKARYAKAVADGHFDVGELFALTAAATIDAVKAVENVPGAAADDKQSAAVETVVSLAGAAIDAYGFPKVPAVIVNSVIKPALLEVVRYFATALVAKLGEILVREGVIKG